MPPHPTSSRSILILSSHLHLGFQVGCFPQISPPKPCTHFCSPHTCYMIRPSYYSRLITPTILGEEYSSLKSTFCIFPHSPVTSSLLGPNILLRYRRYELEYHTGRQSFRLWNFNLLKTIHNLLYIRNQFVPHCKHFPPRL